MKRPSTIYEPSTYRNGDVVVGGFNHQKLRPATKKRKCYNTKEEKGTTYCLSARNVKRRVLRYADKDQVCIIPNRRQISLKERNATWITAKEFRCIQKETAAMIEHLEANSSKHESFSSLVSAASDLKPPPIGTTKEDGEPVEEETSSSSSNSDDDTSKEKEDGDDESPSDETVCVRGLEQHTKSYIANKIAVQRLMHETVEKIRFLQHQDGKEYGHVLAQLCQVCSATAITNALVLGERDAQEAAAAAAGHHG